MKSAAYTGPDDWGTARIFLPDINAEDETGDILEVSYEVFLNTPTGDRLVVREAVRSDGRTYELSAREAEEAMALLWARYEPSEDL